MATGTDLRRMALALKGTTEGPHFDRAAFKVARIYVTLAADGRTANFKFTPDEQQFKCMMAPDAFAPIPNAWGRQGWTTATLSSGGTQERTRNGVGARAEEAQAAMITKRKAWSCAERELRNIRPASSTYSGLLPANFTTLLHFSISSAMSLPNSAGELTNGVAPMSEIRAFILGSVRAALNSLLSLSTISMGVFMGAPTPNQAVTSKPGTKSPKGGTSGRASERVAVVTASARSLPALMCSIDPTRVLK